jgi:hypothetical protein
MSYAKKILSFFSIKCKEFAKVLEVREDWRGNLKSYFIAARAIPTS